MGTETPYLSGVFRFVARLHTLSKRGMRMATGPGRPQMPLWHAAKSVQSH